MKPTQEQVIAWARVNMNDHKEGDLGIGTVKPQREWKGLTEVEIKQLWKDTPQLVGVYSYTDIAREVEAKLKEKNNG